MEFWSKSAGARSLWHVGAALLFIGGLLADPGYAQSPYTLIHTFHSGPRLPIGRLVEGPDGTLYGTTYCGGEPGAGCTGGTIFALRPGAAGTWTFETLQGLRPGLHGGNPAGGLTLARDGSLFGIATRRGRPLTDLATSTIFRMTPAGALSAIHVFPYDAAGVGGFAGEDPVGRLLEGSDGNLYGATCQSGRYGPQSTIFRVTPDGSFNTIHSFRLNETNNTSLALTAPDGWCPMTHLTEVGGFLYGTAIAGGRPLTLFPQLPPSGTLFRLAHLSTPAALTVLHTFHALDGAGPTGAMTPGASGEFYGTTVAGGLFGQGVVFRRDAAGTVRNVHTFLGSDGASPFGSLLRASGGAFYGTTLRGGQGFGTVFRVAGSVFSSLHQFNGADGTGPIEVMQTRDGNLYGATTSAGPGGGGTVYRLNADNSVTTLHAFAGQPRGPVGGVIQATDGNFYGTTDGSSFGAGAVFKLTPAGALTILHEFAAPPGPARADPYVGVGGLMQGADGFLYGRTWFGGLNGSGSIYRISTAGAYTLLHTFDHYAGVDKLMQGSDGNLYGGTLGDSGRAPIIFRVDGAGRVSTVYDFTGTGVASLIGPLAQGPDGALYATAFGSGPFNVGGLFKVTTGGAFTFLYSFESPSEVGHRPVSGLIRSADGGIYGTTTENPFGPPSVFRYNPATNTIAAVARLTTTGSIVEGRDGSIYGWAGDPYSPTPLPRVFRLTAGTVEFLYAMVERDGRSPSALIQATDGALYGTVSQGPWQTVPDTWPDDTFAGGVFRVVVPPPPAAAVVRR